MRVDVDVEEEAALRGIYIYKEEGQRNLSLAEKYSSREEGTRKGRRRSGRAEGRKVELDGFGLPERARRNHRRVFQRKYRES